MIPHRGARTDSLHERLALRRRKRNHTTLVRIESFRRRPCKGVRKKDPPVAREWNPLAPAHLKRPWVAREAQNPSELAIRNLRHDRLADSDLTMAQKTEMEPAAGIFVRIAKVVARAIDPLGDQRSGLAERWGDFVQVLK